MESDSQSNSSRSASLAQLAVLLVDSTEHSNELVPPLAGAAASVKAVCEIGDAEIAWNSGDFDIFIVDIMLGDLQTGLDLAAAVKKQDSGTPVIAITSLSSIETIRRCIDIGIDRYILKPVDTSSLLNELEDLARVVVNRRTIAEQNAKLLVLSKERNRFLSIVAHDLRSPIQSIRDTAEVLNADELKGSAAELLPKVGTSAGYMLQMVNDLLSLSQLESTTLSLNLEEACFDTLVHDSVELQSDYAESKRISLRLSGATGAGEMSLDCAKVRQVIYNLVSNAIKYSEPASDVQLRLTGSPLEVMLEVEDNGAGIAEEQMQQLFTEYGTAGTKPTGGETSTGLGLAIARRIVERHGGEIGCSSALGEGSRFWIRLPTEIDHNSSAASKRAAPTNHAASLSVLYVEDQLMLREQVADYLRPRVARLRTAVNGRLGLEAYLQEPPDLLISDIMMPEMTGLEMCRAIRADDASLPILITTALDDLKHMQQSVEIGVTDYVNKPIAVARLSRRLQSIARDIAAERELAEQNEKLRELDRQKNSFLGMVAHDLRNPIGFIRGSAEFLAHFVSDELSDQQQRHVERIFSLSEHMARLVDDLLDLARIDAGKLQLNFASLPFSDVLESALSMARPIAQKKDIKITVDLCEDVPRVDVDEPRMVQLLNNLLMNAVDHSEDGGAVTVRVTTAAGFVRASIADQGARLDTVSMQQLLKDYSVKRAEAGDDIPAFSIRIARRIIEAHGGSLTLAGEQERGATFTVSLPKD